MLAKFPQKGLQGKQQGQGQDTKLLIMAGQHDLPKLALALLPLTADTPDSGHLEKDKGTEVASS